MALKSKTFTLLGITFCVACLIALIISFASDKWVVSTETQVVGFENLGLWSVCFDQYQPPPYALVDRRYDGCWWVLDKELALLRHYLFPDWFVGTQVMVTLGLVFELMCLLGQIVNTINCFPYSSFRDKISLGISLASALLHGLTGILLSISVIMFGARASTSRSWLEKPDQNYLSWSFGMCVLAAFLAFITMICQLMEFARLRLEFHGEDEPSVYLTDQAPPESRYAYSPPKFPPHPQTDTTERKPAYVSRYYNNGRAYSGRGSEGELVEPRPPDTTFAVSGAGQLYINRMADYDERDEGHGRPGERQYGRGGGTYSNSRYPPRNASTNGQQNGELSDARRRQEDSQNSVPNGNQPRSKQSEHPVLPEYVPKPAKSSEDELDDSEDDTPEKPGLDSSDSDHSRRKGKKKRSSSSRSKDRSSKGKNHKSKKSSKDSDHEDKHRHHSSSKKKSKRGDKHRESDEESTHHRRRSSSKSKSKHRSRSRDLNTSRESFDSIASGARGRSHSRSRRRSRSRSRDKGLEEDRKSHKRSGSREGRSTKKGKSGNWSDDMSEASTRRKGRTAEAKAKSRDYSDGESVRGRSTLKSTRSTQGGDQRPKGTYSSYYEY